MILFSTQPDSSHIFILRKAGQKKAKPNEPAPSSVLCPILWRPSCLLNPIEKKIG
jgi:hypothetical protein